MCSCRWLADLAHPGGGNGSCRLRCQWLLCLLLLLRLRLLLLLQQGHMADREHRTYSMPTPDADIDVTAP